MIFYFISFIFILAFTKGALELIGLNESFLQLAIEFLIVLLFLYSLLTVIRNNIIIAPALIINTFLFITILISYLLTDVNTMEMILFIRKFGIYYLFFYALFNLNLSTIDKEKLFKLILILFLIQIPAACIKLVVLGTQEKIVGTMSVMEGSLATLMPLMGISYLIANYLEFKKVKLIVLILLFIGIGLISNKMGILFYVIVLFVTLSYLYANKYSNTFINTIFIRKLFMISILSLVIFIAFVSLNPRANPEHKVGGSVDMNFLINFIIDYQYLDLKGSRVEGDGRFEAPGVALDRLKKGGLVNVLFGFGPGDIVQSSYSKYKNPLLQKYNIGYGGRIGLVWVLMQIGIIGTILFILFHIILYKKMMIVYHKEKDERMQILILSTLGLSIIYLLDFFTYSSLMIQNSGLAITYFFTIYYVLSE